jgi:hypothetical protein
MSIYGKKKKRKSKSKSNDDDYNDNRFTKALVGQNSCNYTHNNHHKKNNNHKKLRRLSKLQHWRRHTPRYPEAILKAPNR